MLSTIVFHAWHGDVTLKLNLHLCNDKSTTCNDLAQQKFLDSLVGSHGDICIYINKRMEMRALWYDMQEIYLHNILTLNLNTLLKNITSTTYFFQHLQLISNNYV